MRYWFVCIGVACFLVAGCSGAFAADVAVVDEIVCKANGDIITRTDLEKDRKQLETDLRTQRD